MGAGRIGIFGLLFEFILKNRTVFLIGNGANKFQFTDVGDMTDACVKAMAYNGIASETFNIGAENMGTVKEDLLDLIRHAGSKSKLLSIPAGVARFALKTTAQMGIAPLMDEQFMIADKDFALDVSKAKSKLLWQPKSSNFDTLAAAFDWYALHRQQAAGQFKRFLGVFGKFQHSQQGAFQQSTQGQIPTSSDR